MVDLSSDVTTTVHTPGWMDDETRALVVCNKVLMHLTPPQRAAIINYLKERYD